MTCGKQSICASKIGKEEQEFVKEIYATYKNLDYLFDAKKIKIMSMKIIKMLNKNWKIFIQKKYLKTKN